MILEINNLFPSSLIYPVNLKHNVIDDFDNKLKELKQAWTLHLVRVNFNHGALLFIPRTLILRISRGYFFIINYTSGVEQVQFDQLVFFSHFIWLWYFNSLAANPSPCTYSYQMLLWFLQIAVLQYNTK